MEASTLAFASSSAPCLENCNRPTVDTVLARHIASKPIPSFQFTASKAAKEGNVRKDELMKTDLLSEIVLLGSGVAILVALVIVVAAAVTSAAALQ